MKFLGSDIKVFWEEWPLGDEWYSDPPSEEEVIDPETLESGVKYDLHEVFGAVLYQGTTPFPSPNLNGKSVGVEASDVAANGNVIVYPLDTEKYFKAWLKARNVLTQTFTVTVPIAEVARFKALLAENGFTLG